VLDFHDTCIYHFFLFSILKKWINTYTFTKAMAESMIKEISDELPIGIFRPAIGNRTNYNIKHL
jgi:hypothetical protein